MSQKKSTWRKNAVFWRSLKGFKDLSVDDKLEPGK